MHAGYLPGHHAVKERGDQRQGEEHDPTEESFTSTSGGTLRARFAVISDGLERRNYSRGDDRVLIGRRANLGGWASRTENFASARGGNGARRLTPLQR